MTIGENDTMYTYAFLLPPAQPLHLPAGIERPIQLVGTETLIAAVEPELTEARIEAIQKDDRGLMQAILDHDRVLQDLFQQTTILPLRFGTRFLSLQGLLTHLEATATTYLETLHQFQGKAEYALKWVPIEAPAPPLSPDLRGKDYFLAKKQQYQTQLEHQTQQRKEFDRLFQQITQRYSRFTHSPNQDGGATVYLLVDRSQTDELEQQVESWQQQCQCWIVSRTDALPPYHFLEH